MSWELSLRFSSSADVADNPETGTTERPAVGCM